MKVKRDSVFLSAPGGRNVFPEALRNILSCLALCSLILYCTMGSLLTIVGAAKIIPAHGDLTGAESVNPFVGILAVRTGHLYHPMSSPPYTPQPYGPLFYIASAKVAQVAGLDVDATFRLGRSIDFICLVLCALTAWLLGRQVGFSKGESALVAMLLLAQPVLDRWGATMRPDVPMLLMMLLALYFALRSQKTETAFCALSGLLLGVGFLLKQSAAAGGLAIVLVLLLNKKFKHVVVFVLTAGLPIVIAFALLLWHHEPFLEHFFSAGRSTWSLSGAASWLAEPHLNRPTALMLFAVAAAGTWRAIAEGEQGQMLVSFAAVNLLAGLASIPQLGGQTNYFIPAFAGCALLLPFAIRTCQENIDSIRITGIIIILGFLAALADCVAAYHMLPPSDGGRPIPAAYFRSLKILSEDDYLLLHTYDPSLIDPFTVHSLELQGRWSAAGVVNDIRAGKYDLVILGGGYLIPTYRNIALFGPAIVTALNEDYEVLCSAGQGIVLKPRSRDVHVSPETLSHVLRPCVTKSPGPDLMIPYFAQ